MAESTISRTNPKVVIVGCGIAGITAAIALKSQLGIDNVIIYERNAGVGGVWEAGCTCDVRSHVYCSAGKLNPFWSRERAPRDEIQQYWQRIHEEHGLWKVTRYNSELIRAVWVSQWNSWKLTFRDRLTREEFEDDAVIFISAVGTFATPLNRPDSIPGLAGFKGAKFHSSRWDRSVPLSGKTVGLVGNGCSAAQILPQVSQEASTTVINFVRSPQWYFPGPNSEYSNLQKSVFAHVPGLMRLNRWRIMLASDRMFPRLLSQNKKTRETAQNDIIKYIRAIAPVKYHDFLVPHYPLGAKRIIVDPGYLKSLHRDNVELTWDPIDRIVEDGVLQKGRETKVDVLILATGFDLQQFLSAVEVRGLDGRLLSEVWESQGGPQAYYGSCVSGFPNLFMLKGPNANTGHFSIIFFIECQVRWQVKVLRRLLRTRPLVYFNVKAEAEEKYNAWLQDELLKTVWATDKTNPWYRMPSGKIHVLWPSTAIHFWWATLTPRWKDIDFVGARRSPTDITSVIGWTSVATALLGGALYGWRRWVS